MKPIYYTLLISIFFIFSDGIFAQQTDFITVSGKVVSEEDRSPLEGAAVLYSGTYIGTLTDSTGRFSLNVSPEATVVISYVGYEKVEIKAEELLKSNGEFIIPMKIITIVCSITNYSSFSNGCGNYLSIRHGGQEKFNKGNILSVKDLVMGKIEGLRQGINGPLIIIDGIPFMADQGGIDPLTLVSPSEIASINNMRSPAGIAIYGEAGRNGVIEIVTRSVSARKFSAKYQSLLGVGMQDESGGFIQDQRVSLTAGRGNTLVKVAGQFRTQTWGKDNYSLSNGNTRISAKQSLLKNKLAFNADIFMGKETYLGLYSPLDEYHTFSRQITTGPTSYPMNTGNYFLGRARARFSLTDELSFEFESGRYAEKRFQKDGFGNQSLPIPDNPIENYIRTKAEFEKYVDHHTFSVSTRLMKIWNDQYSIPSASTQISYEYRDLVTVEANTRYENYTHRDIHHTQANGGTFTAALQARYSPEIDVACAYSRTELMAGAMYQNGRFGINNQYFLGLGLNLSRLHLQVNYYHNHIEESGLIPYPQDIFSASRITPGQGGNHVLEFSLEGRQYGWSQWFPSISVTTVLGDPQEFKAWYPYGANLGKFYGALSRDMSFRKWNLSYVAMGAKGINLHSPTQSPGGETADVFSLQNLAVSYDLGKKVSEKKYMNIELGLVGQNLFSYSSNPSVKGYEPFYGYPSTNRMMGYPPSRTILLNLEMKIL